jgi:hypothetical protein
MSQLSRDSQSHRRVTKTRNRTTGVGRPEFPTVACRASSPGPNGKPVGDLHEQVDPTDPALGRARAHDHDVACPVDVQILTFLAQRDDRVVTTATSTTPSGCDERTASAIPAKPST